MIRLFAKLQIYTVLALRNIAEQFIAGVSPQQKLLWEKAAQVPLLWGVSSDPAVFSWFTDPLAVLHRKLNTRNVFSFIKSGGNSLPWHFFFQPFALSSASERGVWLKFGYATLRKQIRIKKTPMCSFEEKIYLIECVFLVPSEIIFQSIQCAQLLVFLWDMYKSKSIQEWNKQTKKLITQVFSLRYFVNKNTGFLANIQNQHLYSISFFSEFVSEIVSLFLVQVNLPAPSTDK